MAISCCRIAAAWLCGLADLWQYYDKGKKCYCTVKFIVMSQRCGVEKEQCCLSSPVDSSRESFPPGTGQLVSTGVKKHCGAAGCRQLHLVTSSLNWLKVWSGLPFSFLFYVEKTKAEVLSKLRQWCVAPGVLQELSEGTLAAQTGLCFLFLLGCAVGLFTSVWLCWVTNCWVVTVCGCIPREAALFLWVRTEMGEAVANFTAGKECCQVPEF